MQLIFLFLLYIHLNSMLNTALPLPETSPANFIIEDSGAEGDNSCIYMNPRAMEKLELNQGDILIIINPVTRKQTLGILCEDDPQGSPIKIKINHIFRKNLAAQVNDVVQLSPFKEITEHSKLVVKKIGGSASSATPENHEQMSLVEYFENSYRPVCRDDIFEVKSSIGLMEFMITHTQPSIYGIVTPETLLAIDWQNHQL